MVDDVLKDVAENLKSVPRMTGLRDRALDRVVSIQQELIQDAPHDPKLVEQTAATMFRILDIHKLRGNSNELKQTLDELRILVETAEKNENFEPSKLVNLKRYLLWGITRTFDESSRYNRTSAAFDKLNEAAEILEEIKSSLPDMELNNVQALLCWNEGICREIQNEFDQAEQMYEKATQFAARFSSISKQKHDVLSALSLEANIANSSGILKRRIGEIDEAIVRYGKAKESLERILETRPNRFDLMRKLAGVYSNLGNSLTNKKDWPAAEQSYRRVIQIVEELQLLLPENGGNSRFLAGALQGVALALTRQDNPDSYQEIVELFDRAIQVTNDGKDESSRDGLLCVIGNNRSKFLWLQQKDWQAAIEGYQTVVEKAKVATQKYPNSQGFLNSQSIAASSLSEILVANGDLKRAKQIALENVDFNQKLIDAGKPDAFTLRSLGFAQTS